MAVRADNYMIFLEFLRLTNKSRRREVKERVDPLTKYDDSEFHAWFHLSTLTVYHLPLDVCQRVHLSSFLNIISIYCATAKIMGNHYNYEWHFNDVLQVSRPVACNPLPVWQARPFSLCPRTSVVGLCTTTDLWHLISFFYFIFYIFYISMIKSEYCDYFRL